MAPGLPDGKLYAIVPTFLAKELREPYISASAELALDQSYRFVRYKSRDGKSFGHVLVRREGRTGHEMFVVSPMEMGELPGETVLRILREEEHGAPEDLEARKGLAIECIFRKVEVSDRLALNDSARQRFTLELEAGRLRLDDSIHWKHGSLYCAYSFDDPDLYERHIPTFLEVGADYAVGIPPKNDGDARTTSGWTTADTLFVMANGFLSAKNTVWASFKNRARNHERLIAIGLEYLNRALNAHSKLEIDNISMSLYSIELLSVRTHVSNGALLLRVGLRPRN